jgi:hypothetical protein
VAFLLDLTPHINNLFNSNNKAKEEINKDISYNNSYSIIKKTGIIIIEDANNYYTIKINNSRELI